MAGPVGPVLRVTGLAKSFGEVEALRGVDLTVGRGQVVGLLGPNGAGKTTLVSAIATLLRPDSGIISVCGIDAAADPAGVRSRIGLAGQYASVDELLTGRENLELVGRLYGIDAADAAARGGDLLRSLGLEHAADRRVATYSGGMRRRLDLGATLIGEPELLLLDEPTAGLDPRSRNDLWALVDEIAARGTSVLVTSQHLDEVERLADSVVVLRDGLVIADDRPEALQRAIGGHVLDLHVTGGDAAATAVDTLARCGLAARVDPDRPRVLAPMPGGLPVMADAARRLADARIEPVELALRLPSLEEAFFSLTGDPESGTGDENGADGDGGGPVAVRTTPPIGAALDDWVRPRVTRSALRDIAVVTGRCWKHLLRTPQALFFATVQPLLFVFGLQAVFGDLVELALGDSYIQFLLPGVLVMVLVLAAGSTGVGLATDLREGVIDRLRSLPIAHVAVLAGRTTTDLLRNLLAMVVMVGAGFALGFRFEGGLAGGLAAVAVAVLFGYAAIWVFASVGIAVKDPQAATFIGFAPVLLFVYLSSAWVPIETMDGSVQAFARNQPVNVTIESVRGLANGTDATGQTVQSIAWSVALITVFAVLATRQLRTTRS